MERQIINAGALERKLERTATNGSRMWTYENSVYAISMRYIGDYAADSKHDRMRNYRVWCAVAPKDYDDAPQISVKRGAGSSEILILMTIPSVELTEGGIEWYIDYIRTASQTMAQVRGLIEHHFPGITVASRLPENIEE